MVMFGHRPHDLRAGQWALIWGGSGGFGAMAIQFAKRAGARSIAMISSPDKVGFVTDLGADAWINATWPSWCKHRCVGCATCGRRWG
jgi:crotonyl-CoA carboxylase/reductase